MCLDLFSVRIALFVFYRRSWEFVSDGCYLIGAAKHQNVTGQMAVVLSVTVGAPITSGFFFARALISGRVLHSKHYERVQQRNSYTVMFKEEGSMSYGQIECFAKARQICCQCNVTANCSCSPWMYLAVVNRLSLTLDCVEASDGAVKVTMQHIVKAYPAV